MLPDHKEACYEAFRSKDARFDGRLFVGVRSTGIYCRPVCTARVPKIENCTFFRTAAEAEKAGYRPCLICRPELAPGNAPMDASRILARKAARLLETNCSTGQKLSELAERLGCTDRHLRRVFLEEYHVTPIQYEQTCRLLLAKNLLTDTPLSILEVAMAAGFGSARRMNELFQERYHLTPTALRRAAANRSPSDEMTIRVGYRPPYRWEEIHAFLAKRALLHVEACDETSYARTVRLKDRKGKPVTGWMRVTHDEKKRALRITLSESLVPVLSQVLSGVRRLFDLYCDPGIIEKTLCRMDELAPHLFLPGIRVPGCFDPFETAVRAILGQQITVKAANTLAARITETYGDPVDTGLEGLDRSFPSPEKVLSLGDSLQDCFGRLGVIAARTHTIRELAKAILAGAIILDPCADPEAEMEKLKKIKGIGNWSAQYIAMRTMAWPDAFLDTDSGIKHALPDMTPKERIRTAEAWHPWRSYATLSLWQHPKV